VSKTTVSCAGLTRAGHLGPVHTAILCPMRAASADRSLAMFTRRLDPDDLMRQREG